MTLSYLPGIGPLARRYDGFILDLWGVVHDGIAPIPGCDRLHAGSDQRRQTNSLAVERTTAS